MLNYIQTFTHTVLSTNSITQGLKPDCLGSNIGSVSYLFSVAQLLHLLNTNQNKIT